MAKVRIKENSWLARLAAKKLRFHRIAIVLGHTIYLYNVSLETFLNSKRWVIHELMHVEQYEREGWLNFAWQYIVDYVKVGYYDNKFEIEARNAETDETLLNKYDLSPYLKPGH
jgi:hypothetical protein